VSSGDAGIAANAGLCATVIHWIKSNTNTAHDTGGRKATWFHTSVRVCKRVHREDAKTTLVEIEKETNHRRKTVL